MLSMNRKTKKLLQENNLLEGQLTPENNRTMTDLIVYLRASNTTAYQQECVRRDITEMVLEGQRRGDAMEAVIGADYKAFCDAVLSEVPERTARQRLLSAIGNGCLYVDVLAVIWLAFGALGWLLGEGAWPWLSVTAGNLVALAAILEGNGLITPLVSGVVSIFGLVLMVIALWVQFGKKNGGGGGIGGPRL